MDPTVIAAIIGAVALLIVAAFGAYSAWRDRAEGRLLEERRLRLEERQLAALEKQDAVNGAQLVILDQRRRELLREETIRRARSHDGTAVILGAFALIGIILTASLTAYTTGAAAFAFALIGVAASALAAFLSWQYLKTYREMLSRADELIAAPAADVQALTAGEVADSQGRVAPIGKGMIDPAKYRERPSSGT